MSPTRRGARARRAGYRNGYRTGKVKTAEVAVEYAALQLRARCDAGTVRLGVCGRRFRAAPKRSRISTRGLRRSTSRTPSLTSEAEDFSRATRERDHRAAHCDHGRRRPRRRACFRDPRARGLGDPLLVVSDGASGIIRAIEGCFPRSARQRCLADLMLNLAMKVSADLWPGFKTRVAACCRRRE